jgi:pimeloyl-ACP methyl ester carboxylesterase
VSDLPILGQATIEEAKSLLAYFRDHLHFSRLVVAGSSMGGLHAAMIASVFPGDVGATAWLAPPSAAPVFADGLLAGACNWDMLYRQHTQSLVDKMLRGQGESAGNREAGFTDEDRVEEAKKRMRAFLSITDIDNFGPPRRADAVVFVVGTEDEYLGSTEPQWVVRGVHLHVVGSPQRGLTSVCLSVMCVCVCDGV